MLLDDLHIRGLLPTRLPSGHDRKRELEKIEQTCPNIEELDLSLNLIEDWHDVAQICSVLKQLQSLKVVYATHSHSLLNWQAKYLLGPVEIDSKARKSRTTLLQWKFSGTSKSCPWTRHCCHGERYLLPALAGRSNPSS